MTDSLAVSTPLDNPPSSSARELHEILVRVRALGNTVRKRFIDALRALHESQLCRHLGFPNISAYAEATFRYHRAQTYEFIQVSRALLVLPRLAAAFESGALSWSLVARLSEVSTPETEGEWLEVLHGRRVRAVYQEIRDAREKKRTRPREHRFGLPGLPVKIAFELAPEEHALFEKGIAKVRSEVASSLGGEQLEPKDALLFLLRRVLETEPEGTMTSGRRETGISPFTVVVHKCPGCARGAVDTDAGCVELEPAALERIERKADKVVPEKTAPRSNHPVPGDERDRPNSPALRLAVCQRDGGRCQNPFCGRAVGQDGQAHHIELRSLGGRTELLNETFLCGVCHAAVHAGLLAIEGDPECGLTFRPVAEGLTSAIRRSLEAARAIPEVRTVEVPAVDSGGPEATDDLDRAREALVKLGFSSREARRRLEVVAGRAHPGTKRQDRASVEDLVRESLRL